MRTLARILCLVTVTLAGSLAAVTPESARAQTRHALRGIASWYGRAHHGRRTASGVPFNMFAQSAAHRTLPFGTRVRVTHVRTGRSVEVVVNDRGPYVGQRILDLSRQAAVLLGVVRDGLADVRLEILTPPATGRGETERPVRRSARALAASKLGAGPPAPVSYAESAFDERAETEAFRSPGG